MSKRTKPGLGFDDIVASIRAESRTETPCIEHVLSREDVRSYPPMTEHTLIGASRMGSLCPREESLASILDFTRTEAIEPDLRLVFDIGNAFHSALQNEVLTDRGFLIGRWACVVCGAPQQPVEPGTFPLRSGSADPRDYWTPQPQSCVNGCTRFDADMDNFESLPGHDGRVWVKQRKPSHSNPPMRFVETSMYEPNYGVIMRLDGGINRGSGAIGLLEAKSIDARQFGRTDEPGIAYEDQVHTELWLADMPFAQLLYVSKWFERDIKKTLKEYTIRRSERRIDALKKRIDTTRHAVAKAKLVEDKVCATRSCTRAKRCLLRSRCWSKDPLASV